MTPVSERERDALRGAVRGALDRHDGAPPWSALCAIGAPGLMMPERYGGAGASLREACVVVEELGARLAPGPYLSTAVLAPGLLLALGDDELLPGLADGSVVAALAWPPGGPVPDVADADVVLVPDDGAWHVVDRRDLDVEELTPMDLTRPLARVRRGSVPVRGEAYLTDLACAALAAEQVGGARHCLDTTVAYVTAREQFGRPIGSFQAVQHRLADLAARVTQARSLALDAIDAVADATGDAPALAAAAASLCGETYRLAAAEMLQLHGGIGFTWEHDAHRYLKRAHADACLYGTPERHRGRLAGLIREPAPGS